MLFIEVLRRLINRNVLFFNDGIQICGIGNDLADALDLYTGNVAFRYLLDVVTAISADSQQQNLYHCLLHFLLTPLCRSSSPFGEVFHCTLILSPRCVNVNRQLLSDVTIFALRFMLDISFLFLCRFLLPFILRHLQSICSCCSPNFYSHSGGVRTTFMAPNIFLLLRFFFILSFYISLSPNHYFVISNDSFPLSGLLCGKCKYFRLTNVKKSVK